MVPNSLKMISSSSIIFVLYFKYRYSKSCLICSFMLLLNMFKDIIKKRRLQDFGGQRIYSQQKTQSFYLVVNNKDKLHFKYDANNSFFHLFYSTVLRFNRKVAERSWLQHSAQQSVRCPSLWCFSNTQTALIISWTD